MEKGPQKDKVLRAHKSHNVVLVLKDEVNK